MAAPSVASSIEQAGTNGVTFSWSGDWSAGDICLIWMASDGDNTFNLTDTVSYFGGSGKGFGLVKQASNGASSFGGWVYRRLDGTEDLTSPQIVIYGNESEQCYGICIRISGNPTHEFAIVASLTAYGESSTPDPASVPGPVATRDVLYLAGAAWDHTDTFVSNPSFYTTVQNGNSGTSSGDCGGAVAYRQITGQTDAHDVTGFSISGSEEWVTCSLAVLGDSSPIVSENYAVDTPSGTRPLGTSATTTPLAVSFTPRESCSIEEVSFYGAKIGSPASGVRVSLRTAYDGSDAVYDDVSGIGSAAWYAATFSSPYAVTAGTRYWVVFTYLGTPSVSHYYNIGYEYRSNPVETFRYYDSGAWTEAPEDDIVLLIRKTTGTNANVTPTTVATSTSVPTPALSTGASLTPAAVEAITTIEAPTTAAAASATAGDVAGSTSVPTPEAVMHAPITAGDVMAATAIDTPTVIAEGDASVTPDSVVGAAQAETPTVAAGAIVPIPFARTTGEFGTSNAGVYGAPGTPSEAVGESFTVAAETRLAAVAVQLRKMGSPTDDITLTIESTLGGGGWSVTKAASGITTSTTAWTTFEFPEPVVLSAGTWYFTLTRSGARDIGNYITAYLFTDGASYSGGVRQARANGSWSATSGDHAFRLLPSLAVAAAATVPIPTVEATTSVDVDVTAGDVAAQTAVPTPDATAGSSVTPSEVAASSAIDTPSVSADASLTPDTVGAVADVPTPSVVAGGAGAVITFPNKATNFVAHVITATQIDLTWDAVTGATAYIVTRDDVVIEPANPDTSYSDTNITPNATYRYGVKAVS